MSSRIPTPGSCSRCGVFRTTLHRDHIIPKALGGPDVLENIQLLCANCHEDKTFAEAKAIANDPGVRKRRDAIRRTPEYREQARQRSLGVANSAETRAKISAANRGRPLTPRHRAAIAATWTPEMKEAAAERMRRREWTEEERYGMGSSSRGRPHSEEHRAAISAALRARRAS